MPRSSVIPRVVTDDEGALLNDWLAEQASVAAPGVRANPADRDESREFLALLRNAVQRGNLETPAGVDWTPVRDFLSTMSRGRVQRGASPSQVATFVLSLKQPLFARLRGAVGGDGDALADEIWTATRLIDQLALYTTEVYQKAREEVIARQQSDMLELSTPVVKLWDGILALPMIGTLDSARTQVVMETLLQRIVEQGAEIAIIDITGVPTVDTLTAQHLLKTVTAARLMGADCIISGIRPQIAQTIVHLGVDLGDITTKATLADAFRLALQRTGAPLGRVAPRSV
jgi:rsbT co-antagonist protein RsbR